MSGPVKIGLYVVLVSLVIFFGYRFRSAKHAAEARSAPQAETAPAPTPQAPPPVATNLMAVSNSVPTNATAVATNPVLPGNTVDMPPTNSPASTTNALNVTNQTPTNVVVQAAQTQVSKPSVLTAAGERGGSAGYGKVMAYMGALIVSLIGLGLLVARDITEIIGGSTVEFLFNDVGKGTSDPEYELAEQEWAQGNKLEAIQMMRDYYKKNPREVYVALRIAEIYEKDLLNYLAATLEYEEVLKRKLPRERWGWAAIHLCNLYSKANRQDKTFALLRRIANEYGETKAAEKARKRLALYEGGSTDPMAGDLPENEVVAEVPKAMPDLSEPPVNPAGSTLPPGFRPRKK